MSTSSSGILEDVRVGVPLKISALWIAMLFLFAYGDIFGFFRTGLIEEVIEGEVSGVEITQVFLFGVSVYIAIASAMVFLSLVLRPRGQPPSQHRVADPVHRLDRHLVCRRDVGVLLLLSAAESALLALIVWYAWTWPMREGT